MEAFIGQIMMVGYSFARRGCAFCAGQLLPIASYQSLFSLLGTEYAGMGASIGNTGANMPYKNMQSSLGMNDVIALQGIFPSRN